MGWTNKGLMPYRNIGYNSAVVMTRANVETLLDTFDNIFNDWNNFTKQLTHFFLYPISFDTLLTGDVYLTVTGRKYDIPCNKINPNSVYFYLGQYRVINHFNNFADYNGYTQIKLYLPFLGYIDINPNIIMGKFLQIRLIVDYYNGSGAYLLGTSLNSKPSTGAIRNPDDDDNVEFFATYECKIGIDIPLGFSNAGDIQRNLLLGTLKMATSVGFSALTQDMPDVVRLSERKNTVDIKKRGSSPRAKLKTMESFEDRNIERVEERLPKSKVKSVFDSINSGINVLSNNSLQGSGGDRIANSMCLSYLSTNVHIIFYRPKIEEQTPEFNSLFGKPLGRVISLNAINGYTEIGAVHIEGEGFETITQTEIALLEEAFANGIIL